MFRNLLLFVLFASSSCVVIYGQKTSAAPKAETRVFSTFFDSDGGYLGVQTIEVTKENFAKYGLRDVRGVAVEKVMDASPAQAAGLQNGDVIVKFNGEEITSVRKLTRLIGEVAADHQASLTVLRNGGEREITATLAKRPTPKFGEGSFAMTVPGQTGRVLLPMPETPELAPTPPTGEMPRVWGVPSVPGGQGGNFAWSLGPRRQIGIGVTPLTKQLAEHFGVANGIMVNDVRENSPADKAGLKAGDIITEVDGKGLDSDRDLIRAIAEKKDGDVQLTIMRDGNRQTISVTPEEVKAGFFETPEGGMFSPMAPMRMTMPAIPATPMPLNQMLIPGRVL